MTKHRCSTSEMEAIIASHLGGPFVVAFNSEKNQIIAGEPLEGAEARWKAIQSAGLKRYVPLGSIIINGNLTGDTFQYDGQLN